MVNFSRFCADVFCGRPNAKILQNGKISLTRNIAIILMIRYRSQSLKKIILLFLVPAEPEPIGEMEPIGELQPISEPEPIGEPEPTAEAANIMKVVAVFAGILGFLIMLENIVVLLALTKGKPKQRRSLSCFIGNIAGIL